MHSPKSVSDAGGGSARLCQPPCCRRTVTEQAGGEEPGTRFIRAGIEDLIFAVQMFNFQVLPGVSGHLLGGTLAVILVGP